MAGSASFSMTSLRETMRTWSTLRAATWTLLLVCLLGSLTPTSSAMNSLMPLCNLEKDWMCKRDIENVPIEVVAVCSECQTYWGDYPGLAYCCRCSHIIFEFCLRAVKGNGR